MDPPPPKGPAPEPETLIAACTALLSRRRFTTCRDFALRLPPSHPSLHQILAIVDVLSAADFYSVLNLRPSDAALDPDLPRRQFRNLALLLDPNTNTFPFSHEAFSRLRDAWHSLCDPQRRSLYDRHVGNGTFWTACPYCWNLYEYEVRYQDCALRCEGCRKAFHGVAVEPPVKEEKVVEGEGERRQYYWCHTSVPLRYYDPSEVVEKESENLGEQGFVYISDDDGGGGFGGEVFEENVRNVECEGRVGGLHGNNNGQRRMRVKTVANKVAGSRMRRDADNDLDLDLDGEVGELEFTEGDDDIFVGVRLD